MAIIIAADVTKSEHIRVRMFLWFWVGFSSFLAAKRNAITLVSIALAIVPLSVCWFICASVCVCVCVQVMLCNFILRSLLLTVIYKSFVHFFRPGHKKVKSFAHL